MTPTDAGGHVQDKVAANSYASMYVVQAGEFQCYDERALASLEEAAAAVEQPEWGREGPHDAGEYNSWPEVGLSVLQGCLPDFLLLLQSRTVPV